MSTFAAQQINQAPQWLLTEVATGLERLILLALPGTPASEVMEGTARAFADALWCAPVDWNETLDAPRLAVAFRVIAHRLDRFPGPKQLLAAMPRRPPVKLLPAPPVSKAQRLRNLAFFRAFTARFLAGHKLKP